MFTKISTAYLVGWHNFEKSREDDLKRRDNIPFLTMNIKSRYLTFLNTFIPENNPN